MGIVSEYSKQNTEPQFIAKKLENYFKRQRQVIVAYSGGVDSALLAYAGHRAIKDRMVAVLADSPSLSRREYRAALGFAQKYGIPLRYSKLADRCSWDHMQLVLRSAFK